MALVISDRVKEKEVPDDKQRYNPWASGCGHPKADY